MKTVKSKLVRVFNTLFLGFGIIVIASCNPDNPQPNNPSTGTALQWNVTIDGQTYSWQGSYPNNLGGGTATAGSNGTSSQPFSIACVGPGGTSLGISLPVYNSGTYNLNSSNYALSNYIAVVLNGTPNYSTSYGGTVTVNVTQFPSNVNGVIKGNFSGTIGKSPALGGGTTPITGSFDALRSN
jgi:hypothetical protein